jgi:hypothetical protein
MSGINEDEKLTYEAPKVLKLGELAVGQGACSPGTNPTGVCSPGQFGGGACQPLGDGPQGTCSTGDIYVQ